MAYTRAVALLLAALAACAHVASGHYHHYEMPKYYSEYKVPKNTYTYSGNIYEDFKYVKPYMSYNYYKQCNKYEAPKKVLIIECLLQYKCFDYAPKPCCTSDGYQFQHICFAQCFGYKVVDITIGKCSPPPPSPVAAPPPNNCGMNLYCSDKQQCCNTNGYYSCCDKSASCCGDKCCSYGQMCYKYVSYDSYGKKVYSYECKAPPPPSPVAAPPAYNCGMSLYCSDKQQCCNSYGYYSCCDKSASCCGDKCCSYGQMCYKYVSYYSYGKKKKVYSYECKAPPPPSPVAAPPANNCGMNLYCSDKQQCCNTNGYYSCCDKSASCCGDKCCSYGQECYKSMDNYGKYMYACKDMMYPAVSENNPPYNDQQQYVYKYDDNGGDNKGNYGHGDGEDHHGGHGHGDGGDK